jgi:hypothetical protein
MAQVHRHRGIRPKSRKLMSSSNTSAACAYETCVRNVCLLLQVCFIHAQTSGSTCNQYCQSKGRVCMQAAEYASAGLHRLPMN